MKNLIVFIILISTMFLTSVNAQDQATRFEKQHHSQYVKSNLKQTEEMILTSLNSDNIGILASTAQTIRQLEQIFPENTFSSLLDPLMKIVQDEKGDTQVRILSALALDNLHSDKGDKAIYGVAKNTKNKSVQDVCIALSVESLKNDIADKTTN
jgi:hypothetical protein